MAAMANMQPNSTVLNPAHELAQVRVLLQYVAVGRVYLVPSETVYNLQAKLADAAVATGFHAIDIVRTCSIPAIHTPNCGQHHEEEDEEGMHGPNLR